MYLGPTSKLFPNMEAIVEYNYVAQQEDELTLRKGDIITGIKMMLGGWWEGTLRDKRGMFPDNFVKVLDPTKASSGSSENAENIKSDDVIIKDGSSKRVCKVLYTYEPCNDDELTLELDDVIEFLGEVEEGWWRGRLKGKVGVFPSNFVSPPVPEVQEKHKERDKKELCRVLFQYEADNEDELTLAEGDVITLLSRDAFDKGWWKGELRGQVGLFPDNFVEVITVKDENETVIPVNVKASNRTSHQMDIVTKSHARKSLDTKNSSNSNNTNNKSDSIKKISTASSSMSTSLGSIGGSEKKAISGHSIISSLKRLVSDVGNNNGIGNASSALEELDGVERREGTLSHLTASRAKAPRRRPPSSQHLHYHAITSVNRNAAPTLPSPPNNTEDNLSNGRTDTILEQTPDEETDGLAIKARKKAPWVEELKMNQMERKRNAAVGVVVDRHLKTERILSWTTNLDSPNSDDELNNKQKNKIQKTNINPHADHNPASSSEQSGYVPYAVYSKLLERVATLEEKQSVLQHTIEQLSEMLIPLLSNQSINSKA